VTALALFTFALAVWIIRRHDVTWTEPMTLTSPPARRARLRLAAAVTAAATVSLIATSTPSFASTGAGIHVRGSGVRSASSPGDVPFTFSFNAIATPAHSDGVDGAFSGSFPHDAPFPAPGNFATFHGAVTCLKVSGDMATIGGVLTSGYGYDDTYTQGQRDLTGDWFITTVQDPTSGSPDTMGYIDWGDRGYFAGQGFSSFASLCDNPTADLGTSQFPLSSGEIKISD
jgi:hypothetical protein